MAKCPNCGTEVSTPIKIWTMVGRSDSFGKKMQLEIGLFECQRFRRPFRTVLNKRKILDRGASQSLNICKACGYNNLRNYQFCGKCNTSLAEEETRIYSAPRN